MTRNKDEEGQLSILDLLPANRRREIFAEALHGEVGNVLRQNPRATLGEFVELLRENRFWDALKEIPVGTVLSPAGGGGGTVAARPVAPRTRAPRLNDSVIDRVLTYIEKNPGQKAEQIQAGLRNLDRGEVNRALARLRQDKRVRTEGARRSMSYAV